MEDNFEINLYDYEINVSPEELYLFLLKLKSQYHLTDLTGLYEYCKEEKPENCEMVLNFAKDFKIKCSV